MELAGILFDVDGTIAESEEVHRKSFNESFKEFGVKWHWDRAIYKELLNIEGGRERIQYYIERTDPDQLNRPDLSSFISSIHDAKSQVYSALMTKEGVPIRPGALRLIKEAKNCGCEIAKLQTYTGANRVSDSVKEAKYADRTLGMEESPSEMFSRFELSYNDHVELMEYSKEVGISLISTPFDEKSVDILLDLGV